MAQQGGQWGKRRSPLTHPNPYVAAVDFKRNWDQVLENNPGVRDLVRPDYQYNYYDPPHDLNTAEFLHDLNTSFPWNRHKLIRKFLPEKLYQYKALVSRLPFSQLQQLREQLYIGRIGDLGTNYPCTFTRRHWVYRLTNSDEPVNSQTLREMPLGEVMRWYETAITNIFTDCAEEEYLRYKMCLGNRMPLVMKASIHNPVHYNPMEKVSIEHSIPAPACTPLMGMVHDSHRYFTKVIQNDCQTHFQPFFEALVHQRDLNEALIKYEKIQRCAIGRELRARSQTDTPTFAGAWQIMGRTFPVLFFPRIFFNWLEIRSNPVVEFNEPDCDVVPVFDGMNVPAMKPLLDELRTELVMEGKLAPEPLRSYQTPFNFTPSTQTPASAQTALALKAQPTASFGQDSDYFYDQSIKPMMLSSPPTSSYVNVPPHMRDE